MTFKLNIYSPSLFFFNILCPPSLFTYYTCLCFVVNIVNKFKAPVWGHTEIPGGECHRHKIRVKEKTMKFGCSSSNWGFWQWCQQMCRWTMAFPLYMHSGFPTEKVEQMIMMSLSGITVIGHAIGGGKYIRKASSSFWAVVWVSGTEWLGLLLSHQPSTLAISVPLMEQEYNLDKLFTFFIHVHFLGTL